MATRKYLDSKFEGQINSLDTYLDILNSDFEKICQIEKPNNEVISNMNKGITKLREACIFFTPMTRQGRILKIKTLGEVTHGIKTQNP